MLRAVEQLTGRADAVAAEGTSAAAAEDGDDGTETADAQRALPQSEQSGQEDGEASVADTYNETSGISESDDSYYSSAARQRQRQPRKGQQPRPSVD